MKAFQTGRVTKSQLMQSLEQHRDQDSFRKGAFWNDDSATGCGVGCSIHDFSPGAEQEHAEYETLFGIPAELAVLEDHVFEALRYDGGPQDLSAWPLAFARAVPEGADLDRTAGRWILALLTHGDGPLAHARTKPAIQEAAQWLEHWLETGEPTPTALMHVPPKPDENWPESSVHSMNVAVATISYIRHRTKPEPYVSHDMFLLTEIFMHAGLAQTQHQRAGTGDGQEPLRSDPAIELKMAELLLEAITASPTTV